MEVSLSGYYAWLTRPESKRNQENKQIIKEIKEVDKQCRHSYGSPRIYRELKAKGISCSENKVARLMQKNGIAAKGKENLWSLQPVAKNKLNQEFSASRPNEKWVTDITYIWTKEGWLYLAVVLDLFSRKVVGWSMDETMEKDLVINALNMALRSRQPEKGLLHHSDRGSQYASSDYQKLLMDQQITCSMSRKGNCYDNAVVESFFSTLKQELVFHQQYQSRQHAKQDIFEYIEVWYNRRRRHSSLGYVSPEEFENLNQYAVAA
jgi:putative transposase